MNKLILLLLLSLGFVETSYADAICNDGWISPSTGSGTCSWHGGVKKWLKKNKQSNDDDFYWPDDEIFDPCDNRNRPRGLTEQECLNSPWSNANRIKRILEEQKNDNQSNHIIRKMQEQNEENQLIILRLIQENSELF